MNGIQRLVTRMDALADRLVTLNAKFRSVPRFRWGVVVSTDPLRIQLDGDEEPLAGRPPTLVKGLAVNGRVMVLIQNQRATIVGKAKGGGSRILWDGTPIYLQVGQTAALSGRVSEQDTGIIVAWSRYASSEAQNDNWNYCFVPKEHVYFSPGAGVRMMVQQGTTTAGKYVYVHDDRLTGLAANGTAPESNFVLRRVIGV